MTVQEFSPTTAASDSVRNEPSTSSGIDDENEMANGNDRKKQLFHKTIGDE